MDKYINLLIGLIFIGLSIYAIQLYVRKTRRIRLQGQEVSAIIIKFTGAYIRKRKRTYTDTLIRYTVYGHTIETKLGYYSNNMKVGDKLKIYVSDNDPQDFAYAGIGPIITGMLFLIIGLVLAVISLAQ